MKLFHDLITSIFNLNFNINEQIINKITQLKMVAKNALKTEIVCLKLSIIPTVSI